MSVLVRAAVLIFQARFREAADMAATATAREVTSHAHSDWQPVHARWLMHVTSPALQLSLEARAQCRLPLQDLGGDPFEFGKVASLTLPTCAHFAHCYAHFAHCYSESRSPAPCLV